MNAPTLRLTYHNPDELKSNMLATILDSAEKSGCYVEVIRQTALYDDMEAIYSELRGLAQQIRQRTRAFTISTEPLFTATFFAPAALAF